MTRNQAAKDANKLKLHDHGIDPSKASLDLWSYLSHVGSDNDTDDVCASVLASELATGADDILPELDQ